jgi:hypothetical protein
MTILWKTLEEHFSKWPIDRCEDLTYVAAPQRLFHNERHVSTSWCTQHDLCTEHDWPSHLNLRPEQSCLAYLYHFYNVIHDIAQRSVVRGHYTGFILSDDCITPRHNFAGNSSIQWVINRQRRVITDLTSMKAQQKRRRDGDQLILTVLTASKFCVSVSSSTPTL